MGNRQGSGDGLASHAKHKKAPHKGGAAGRGQGVGYLSLTAVPVTKTTTMPPRPLGMLIS